MNALIILNPWAGATPPRPLVERAARWWRNNGWLVELETTAGPGDAELLARQATIAGQQAVIVAGGDGTLSEAAQGLAGSQTALGLLPLGTSNVWAREIGLRPLVGPGRASPEAVARAIAASTPRRIDLGKAGSRHFMLWLGLGLDGHVVSSVEPRGRVAKLLGEPYYVAATFAAAAGWAGTQLQVEVDGDCISGHVLLLLVGNIRRYAGQMFRPSPHARVDDGLLEVWVFFGKGFGQALDQAWRLYHGRHVGHETVAFRMGRQVRISGQTPIPGQVDGERWSADLPVEVSVDPLALNVLVPRGAPADLFSAMI